jgi:chemotaxis protein histidine kinase CheA
MNGRITAESEVGKGTVIALSLPRSQVILAS